ncbi:hypothetical protein HDV06_002583 [Boothiomyces sp. JEL0866]|nr:hypothetical protein HDV06_002583 [Boothiomyces sp. JEL0866]
MTSAKCDLCIVNNELPAMHVCESCKTYLCKEHMKNHKKTRFTAHHNVIVLEYMNEKYIQEFKKQRSVIVSTELCTAHPSEVVDDFCMDCKLMACKVCSNLTHNAHEIVTVLDAVEALSGEFDISVDPDMSSYDLMEKEVEVTYTKKSAELESEIRRMVMKMKFLKEEISEERQSALFEIQHQRSNHHRLIQTITDWSDKSNPVKLLREYLVNAQFVKEYKNRLLETSPADSKTSRLETLSEAAKRALPFFPSNSPSANGDLKVSVVIKEPPRFQQSPPLLPPPKLFVINHVDESGKTVERVVARPAYQNHQAKGIEPLPTNNSHPNTSKMNVLSDDSKVEQQVPRVLPQKKAVSFQTRTNPVSILKRKNSDPINNIKQDIGVVGTDIAGNVEVLEINPIRAPVKQPVTIRHPRKSILADQSNRKVEASSGLPVKTVVKNIQHEASTSPAVPGKKAVDFEEPHERQSICIPVSSSSDNALTESNSGKLLNSVATLESKAQDNEVIEVVLPVKQTLVIKAPFKPAEVEIAASSEMNTTDISVETKVTRPREPLIKSSLSFKDPPQPITPNTLEAPCTPDIVLANSQSLNTTCHTSTADSEQHEPEVEVVLPVKKGVIIKAPYKPISIKKPEVIPSEVDKSLRITQEEVDTLPIVVLPVKLPALHTNLNDALLNELPVKVLRKSLKFSNIDSIEEFVPPSSTTLQSNLAEDLNNNRNRKGYKSAARVDVNDTDLNTGKKSLVSLISTRVASIKEFVPGAITSDSLQNTENIHKLPNSVISTLPAITSRVGDIDSSDKSLKNCSVGANSTKLKVLDFEQNFGDSVQNILEPTECYKEMPIDIPPLSASDENEISGKEERIPEKKKGKYSFKDIFSKGISEFVPVNSKVEVKPNIETKDNTLAPNPENEKEKAQEERKSFRDIIAKGVNEFVPVNPKVEVKHNATHKYSNEAPKTENEKKIMNGNGELAKVEYNRDSPNKKTFPQENKYIRSTEMAKETTDNTNNFNILSKKVEIQQLETNLKANRNLFGCDDLPLDNIEIKLESGKSADLSSGNPIIDSRGKNVQACGNQVEDSNLIDSNPANVIRDNANKKQLEVEADVTDSAGFKSQNVLRVTSDVDLLNFANVQQPLSSNDLKCMDTFDDYVPYFDTDSDKAFLEPVVDNTNQYKELPNGTPSDSSFEELMGILLGTMSTNDKPNFLKQT